MPGHFRQHMQLRVFPMSPIPSLAPCLAFGRAIMRFTHRAEHGCMLITCSGPALGSSSAAVPPASPADYLLASHKIAHTRP